MMEQNKQQEKKLRNIKMRTDQIRKDYEKRLSKAGAFVPQTYGQGMLFFPDFLCRFTWFFGIIHKGY